VTNQKAKTFHLSTKTFKIIFINILICFFPVLLIAQTITLSSDNPAIPAANIALNSSMQPIYRATIRVAGGNGVNFNTLTFIPTGTFLQSDINTANNNYGYRVWMSKTDNLSGATQISNIFKPNDSGNLMTISINNPTLNNETDYIWITVDISPNAIIGHTIKVGTLSINNFTFSAGTKNGTMYAGETQTLIGSGSNILIGTSDLLGFSYMALLHINHIQ